MVRALRLSSFCFVVASITAALTLGLLAYSFFNKELDSIYLYAGAAGTTLSFGILALIIGSKCRCQLCQVSLIMPQKFSKHKNAKRLFFSYRLHLTSSVLLLNRYTCSCCGESFSCAVPEATNQPNAAAISEQQIISGSHRPIRTIRDTKQSPRKKQFR